jgi:hypothetical protein
VVTAGKYRIELDPSTQVLNIDVPKMVITGNAAEGNETPILPRLPFDHPDKFLSAAVLAQKAKQFDDGLYAAVELAAESGLGDFPGKKALLQTICTALANADPEQAGKAQRILFGAAKLGNVPVTVPDRLDAMVREEIKTFQSDELRSKPIGFYTWSPELRAIFQQDRMLQSPILDRTVAVFLAQTIARDSLAGTGCDAWLTLVSRLTNPFTTRTKDLRSLLKDSAGPPPSTPEVFAFLPPSAAHETDLIMKLYGDNPIPEDFNLADEMIQRIQSGQLSLKPTASSGWYDHQTWALEPLLVPEKTPEAPRLKFNEEYRKLLRELFKGTLALTRETHIKQVETPWSAECPPMEEREPPIFIYPGLTTEPLPTHYLRRSQAYAFVRGVLQQTFGPKALSTMHRLTADGPVATNLDEELLQMQALCFGAYVSSAREVGLLPDAPAATVSGNGADADVAQFSKWRQDLSRDPDLGTDCRTMVPVFYDQIRQKTKVWLLLGWDMRTAEVFYSKHPNFRVLDAKSGREVKKHPEVQFLSESHSIVYPVVAEIYVDRILDRTEFRKLCDQYKTREAILQHLEANTGR